MNSFYTLGTYEIINYNKSLSEGISMTIFQIIA